MNRQLLKKTSMFFLIVLFGTLLSCVYTLATPPQPTQHLNNIKQRLTSGEAQSAQQLFPEGAFFSHMLYGTSWINIGLFSQDQAVRQQAVTEATWALQQLESDSLATPFSQATELDHGIFYSGWLNRLRGGILLIQKSKPDPYIQEQFMIESTRIAEAFTKTQLPFLSSYPNQTWPADTIPALSSLAIHDRLYQTEYRNTVLIPWKGKLTALYAPYSVLIPHQVDSVTGLPIKPARGASTGLLLTILPEVDSQLSRQLYTTYQAEFLDTNPFFSLTREYARSMDAVPNTNSGPVFLGYGASATAVSIAAAHANSEPALARRTFKIMNLLGMPTKHQQSEQYLLGKVLIFDIFLTWARTHRQWI